MSLQFIYDNKGNTTGVFLPIEDWNKLSKAYNELDVYDELPERQKELFDKRVELLQKHPEKVTALEDFLIEIEQ